MALARIASLWIGPELSWLEQLCIQSFLDAGHEFTLFVYDDVKGVPDGVKIADANEHLKTDEFIRHARTGSPAYHADQFRLRMIRDTNLTWVDTDAYCVRPFHIERHGHLHGWIADARPQINNGVLKLPKKSKTLKAMLDFTSDPYPIPPWYSEEKQERLRKLKEEGRGVHVSLLPWGVWGPNALTHFLHATGEVKHSKPKHVLYPVPFSHKQSLIKPRRRHIVEEAVRADTLSIHFWGRRFRAAVSKMGGIPPEGSYVADLLRKHGIDPRPTAHMMKPVQAPATVIPSPERVDFSMLDEDDLVNLVLQRSETIRDRAAIRAWTKGDEAPLRAKVRAERERILAAAFARLGKVFQTITPALDRLKPARLADIGAGYGFIDLLLHRRYGSDIILIDIEESENRHFGFEAEGAGYSSLAKARDFLVANGVPEARIRTLNPKREDPCEVGEVDLAMSLISCGFHYPASTYDAFFAGNVAPTGGILLDIRKGSGGIPYLKKFGRTTVLAQEGKAARVYTQKTVA